MSKNKINLIKKKKESYVEVKIEENQNLDSRVLEIIQNRRIPSLLTPVVNKKKLIKYNVSQYISLKEYLNSVFNKDRFLKMIIYILSSLKEGQELMLSSRNYILDREFIFVNQMTKEFFYVYVPIINYENETNYKTFFRDLAFNTVFNQMEECSYVKEYIDYFNQHIDFSLYDFEIFIHKMHGEQVDKKSAISASQQLSSAKSNDEAIYKVDFDSIPIAHPSKLLNNDNIVIKICPNCKTKSNENRNYCYKCGTKLVTPDELPPKPEDQRIFDATGNNMENSSKTIKKKIGTIILGAENYDKKGTTVLTSEELSKYKVANLIRLRTDEQIEINKNQFLIGQKEGSADYCVEDNTAISRVHAYILSEAGKYYVMDKKSTNRTYIDNHIVEYNVKTEIKDGQILRLGNEEFKFEL